MGKQTERNNKKKAGSAAEMGDVTADASNGQQQGSNGVQNLSSRISDLRNSVGEYTEIYTERIRSEWNEKTAKIVESELYRETLSPKFQSAKEYTEEQLEVILQKAKELAKAGFAKSKEVYSEKVVPYWNETVVPGVTQKWGELKEYSKEKIIPGIKEYSQVIYVKGCELVIQTKEKVVVMSKELFEAAKKSATGVAMEKYYAEQV